MDVHLLATSVASRFCITHPNSSITSIFSSANDSVVLEHLSSTSQKTLRCEMTAEEAIESARAFAVHAAYAEIGFAPDQDNRSLVQTQISENHILSKDGKVIFTHAYTGNQPAAEKSDIEMRIKLSPPGAIKIGEGLSAVGTQTLFRRIISERYSEIR